MPFHHSVYWNVQGPRLCLFIGLIVSVALSFAAHDSLWAQDPAAESGVPPATDNNQTDANPDDADSDAPIRLPSIDEEPASTPDVPTPPPTPVQETISRQEELEKQLASLEGLLATIEEKKGQQTEEMTALDAEIEKFRRDGFSETPPYPLSLLDSLRDQLETATLAKQISEATLASKINAAEAARKQFEVKETARRLAKEAMESANDETSRANREETFKLAELESKIAETAFDLRKAEVEDNRATLDLQQKWIDFLNEKIALATESIQFTDEELTQRLTELGTQENETNALIQSASSRQFYVEDRWQDAVRRMENTDDPAIRESLAEEVEAWRLARRQIQEQLLVGNRRLQMLGFLRTAWQRRHTLYNADPGAAEIKVWREETLDALSQIEGDLRVRNAQLEQIRNLLTTLQSKIEKLPADAPPEKTRWLNTQEQHLVELIRTYGGSTSFLARSKRLYDRLLVDLGAEAAQLTWGEWFNGVYDDWLKIWNYEVGVVDESPITVRKIAIGLLIVLVGFWLAHFISRTLEKRVFEKSLVTKDTAAVFRTLIFYFLLAVVLVIALWFANVPLTVFTFLGGALAIGFGLGSQNLVNNFLSGLVIMSERPVRIGERIMFGGYDGIVEEVGYRCTKLRTLTGHLVTIPNSQLINDQVENIERRPYIRRSFDIGIPYNTPRAKVAEAVEILKAILDEEGIREPIHPTIGVDYFPPRVFFKDYNADNLAIWVIYWYSPPWFWDYMEHTERVNFRIMEEFERIGVEFAFPTQKLYVEQEEPKALPR